jgi:hypothetical protein
MLLFLQFLSDGNFSHVVFEDTAWEDATFHFNDDKKIYLEVKDLTSKPISLAYVKREIFPSFLNKMKLIGKDDKILIAGPDFDKEVKSYADSLEYLSNWTAPKLKDKGFSDDEISLLGKTTVFQFNEWLDINLVAYLSPVLGFWLPETELENFKDHILQKVAVDKSSRGETLTRDEFSILIAKERDTLRVGIFDPEKHSTAERVTEILATLNDAKERTRTIDNPRVLSSLMSNPSDVNLLLMVLEKEVIKSGSFDIEKWGALFAASIHPAYAFRLVFLFENILKANHDYDDFFLDFWSRNIAQIIPPYQDGHLVGQILKMSSSIISYSPSFADKSFTILQEAYKILCRGKFEESKGWVRNEHDRNQLGELARQIHSVATIELKQELMKWAHASFALNREHGEYLSATPSSIFILWRESMLTSQGTDGIERFISIVEDDYLSDPHLIATRGRKKGRSIYEGFDHMGSGISQSGDHYSITDLAFVEIVLKPFLSQWYEHDPEALWSYIPSWISALQSEVGLYKDGKKPDYLSRALIPVLVRYYFSDDSSKSKQAYKWLTSSMKFRKGIPSRTELIFQELHTHHPSAQKAWKLVQYQLKIKEYNKAPANIFVEMLLRTFLIEGLKEPLPYVENLINNETYLRYQGSKDFYLTDLITSLISNPKTSSVGASLLEQLLASSFYNERISNFDVYDIKEPIQALFTTDNAAGCMLLKKIASDSPTLTKNRQIALTVVLRDLPDDRNTLEDVYVTVFQSLVQRAKRKEIELSSYLSFDHSREELAEFAGRLCKVGSYEYGIEVLEVLVHDPSPSTEEYQEDMLKSNDMHAIQSVRAHVSWAIQSFVTIEGRKYLRSGFEMLALLAKDENIYIRSQACFPLNSYVQARHYHMPEPSSERYMDIALVRDVDKLALSLLYNKENHTYPAMTKAIIHVVSYMRALSTVDAKNLVNEVLDTNDSGIEDYIPTLFFFAEFREKAFAKWPWEKDFPIGTFKSAYFQECIKKLSTSGSSQVRTTIAWTLWTGLSKGELAKDKAIEIIDRYADSLISSFGREWYGDLYHMADELLKKDEVARGLAIWKKCIATEYEAVSKSTFISDGYRGHHYDGEMLMAINETEGNAEFQKWLELVLHDEFETYISDVKGLYSLASKANKDRMLNLYPHVLIDELPQH